MLTEPLSSTAIKATTSNEVAEAVSEQRISVPEIQGESWTSHKGWAFIWLTISMPLAMHVIQSWYGNLSQKTLEADLIPVLAALILTSVMPRYVKTAPPLQIRFDSIGLIIFAFMAAVNCTSNYLHLYRIFWLSFAGMLFGFLWAMTGKRYCRHWFPVFLFATELMPGSPLAFLEWCSALLRLASVQLATALSTPFIPLIVENNVFYLKGNAIQISLACSGLSVWTALIFVVLLWQLITSISVRNLALLLALTAVVAVATNGIRLAITAIVAYHSSVESAMAIHSDLEYVLLPLALLSLWQFQRVVSK